MTISGIISAIVVGLVLGALGRLVLPGKQDIPIWLTMLVGIAAAFVGSAIARALGYAETRGWDWLEFLTQLGIAALGVSLVTGMYMRRKNRIHS
ncbi:GlsB/YeaQ/YmgE family stress response membrane protein [Saccharomonospora sp. NPDC046836]|uniref:GlsB/YeaQ/YmgE family stress response membrane protein n=1 Tax=Saccharomonospora sp. NPDC046836 TaxID=3156921 RepID=UPI0033CC77E4